jgi:hypothetical protein
MSEVLLFSKMTTLGLIEVRTSLSTFDITQKTYGQQYSLHFSFDSEFIRYFFSPYKALSAVAKHASGQSAWDSSSEAVSDYAPDWDRHISQKSKVDMLGKFATARPHASLRELVDYFEHKHPYLFDRVEINDLLCDLIATGQLNEAIDDYRVPLELRGAAELAKKWLGKLTEEDDI